MSFFDKSALDPYFTDPTNHDARHRNDTEQARADGIRDDYFAARSHPCHHYRPHHSAFVAKVRGAA